MGNTKTLSFSIMNVSLNVLAITTRVFKVLLQIKDYILKQHFCVDFLHFDKEIP